MAKKKTALSNFARLLTHADTYPLVLRTSLYMAALRTRSAARRIPPLQCQAVLAEGSITCFTHLDLEKDFVYAPALNQL